MTVATAPAYRRVAGWSAVAAGLGASAAAVALGVVSARPPGPAGALPTAAPPAVAVPSADASSPAPATPPTVTEGVPTELSIAALHVTAGVRPVGVGPDRSLDIPADPAQLGWWIGSAMPGAPRGTVLVAGHVDTARDGPGALFKLETLPMGALIRMGTGDHTVTYRAVARRSYSKQHLPAELFGTGTPAELALVTCGGTFRDGTYSHNVVVYAEPVS
jgi:hypothetical protein